MPTPIITEVHTGTKRCSNCGSFDKVVGKCNQDNMPIPLEDAKHQLCRTWIPEEKKEAPALDMKPPVPGRVWTRSITFDLFRADDTAKLKLGDNPLKLNDSYWLVNVPVVDCRMQGQNMQLCLDGGMWDDTHPAHIWCTFNDGCWVSLKKATQCVLKNLRDSLAHLLLCSDDLLEMLDEHKLYLSSRTEWGDEVGEFLFKMTGRHSLYFGEYMDNLTKILLQYKRLSAQERMSSEPTPRSRTYTVLGTVKPDSQEIFHEKK